MTFKDIFWAFPWLRQGRALARLGSAILAFALLATIPNALLSCKAKDKTDNSGLQAATEAKNTVSEAPEKAAKTSTSTAAASDPSKVDLDLTKMSATMIYSTIFDMLVMAEDYIEKNIKVTGWFETYTDPQTGELYYAVVVPDATACCQQGLEFVWPGNHTYPDDFPKPGEDITITGIYKLIETDGVTYTYLEANSVEF
jgi:hypothetical protein